MTEKTVKKVFEMGSEYDWDSNQPYLIEPSDDLWDVIPEDRIKYLRSGRDAIRYAARLHQDSCGTVLMPALCCTCMPKAFEDEGYKVVYYRLNPDLTIDFDDVGMKIKNHSIFMYMNYFGQPAFRSDDLKEAVKHMDHIVTMEDVTHDFFYRTADSFQADYTVCSIRKWFAIPDGGVLLSREPVGILPLAPDSYFADTRKEGLEHKSRYLCNGISEEKEFYREAFAKANAYLDMADNITMMDSRSESLLHSVNLNKMYAERCRNTELLQNELENIPRIHSLVNNPGRSTLYYPILTEENQLLLEKRLSEEGLYLPVIWPLPEKARGICSAADYISAHMLAFPCDHRYGTDDIKRAADILRDSVG